MLEIVLDKVPPYNQVEYLRGRALVEEMSGREVLDKWLRYEGIIGYTDKLINLVAGVIDGTR